MLPRLGQLGTVRARWLPQPQQAEEQCGVCPACSPLKFPTTNGWVCFCSWLFPRDTHRGVLDPCSGCSSGSRAAPRLTCHVCPQPLCPIMQKISWGKDSGSGRFLETVQGPVPLFPRSARILAINQRIFPAQHSRCQTTALCLCFCLSFPITSLLFASLWPLL